ncbi:MAG TPA: hypothetical protein VKX34_09895 [Aequorivita sp.]|nr:hypothetical protein [Aequorivita sp.]
MNFQYSYRAFLITSLLTGCLVLFLYSLKLSKNKVQVQEETIDVEITSEDLLLLEQELAAVTPEEVKIETNKGYNEAEEYISSVENENQKISDITEGKLQELDEAIKSSQNELNGKEGLESSKTGKKEKKNFSNSESKSNNEAVVKGGNRNTTISYRLVDRKDIDLPNPVYTCYGSGKVVINIEVDQLGRVKKTSYNKAASTTSNACLIDAAKEYSAQARFTAHDTRKKQLGTITFNFPGQN